MVTSLNLTFSGNTALNSTPKTKNQLYIAFTGAVDGLKPEKVWKNFEEITKIPRASGNNQQISEHLQRKLEKAGFEVKVKGPEADVLGHDGKVIGQGQYTIVATRNVDKAKKDAIILQAHMDMVSISADKKHDKPIQLIKDGNYIRANDRTLGADNGTGLAMALAIAEEPEFKKFPLEIIFTTDEEIGLYGARGLNKDDIHGKSLINLDSEESNVITTGCAGVDMYKEEEKVPTVAIGNDKYKSINLAISGAKGGHSGIVINQEHINPIKAILSELGDLSKQYKDIRLSTIVGGEKPNSIPKEVNAQILVPQEKAEEISELLRERFAKIEQDSSSFEPSLRSKILVSNKTSDPDTRVVTPEFQNKLFQILGKDLLSGMQTSFKNGNPKTSQNLGVIDLKDGNLRIQLCSRSNSVKERPGLRKNTTSQLSSLLDKDVKPESSPVWTPKPDAASLAVETYKRLNGEEPKVEITHGGLENAYFDKFGLKHVSIGADMEGAHDVKERVFIPTMEKSYKFVQELIKAVHNKQNSTN